MKRYLKTALLAGFAWGASMFGFLTAEFISPIQLDISAVQKLILCIGGGVVFGVLIALVLYVFDRKRLNKGIDVHKDELRPTDSIVLKTPINMAMNKVINSISVLNNPKIKLQSKDELIVKTGVNKRTFGEIVSINLKNTIENSTLIQISSRPKSKYTLVDYGMNSDNVRNLIEAISKD